MMMEDLMSADFDFDFDVDSSNLDFLPDDFEFEFTEDDLNNFDESVIPDLAALIRLEEEEEAAEAAAAVAAVAACEKAEKAMKEAEESEEMEYSYDLELEANNFFTDEHQFSNNFSTSLKDNSFKDNLLKECAVLSDLFGLNGSDSNIGVSSDFPSKESSFVAQPVAHQQMQSPMQPETVAYDSGIDSSGCTPVASPAPSTMSSKDAFEGHSYLSDGNSLDGSNSSFDMFSSSSQEALTFAGFESYYALDQHNNLVRQPLNSLTVEEINSLTAAFAGAGVSFKPEVVATTSPVTKKGPTLVSSQRRQKRKGVSLLAKPPKSVKAVKREMEQSKLKSQQQPLKTIEINTPSSSSIISSSMSSSLMLHQDHDYCSEVRVLN